jgi:hypothetical protein
MDDMAPLADAMAIGSPCVDMELCMNDVQTGTTFCAVAVFTTFTHAYHNRSLQRISFVRDFPLPLTLRSKQR